MHRYLLALLALFAVLVWLAVFSLPDANLHIIACDVGQGDAILATYKNFQVLTDGGGNNSVLDCLGKYMPFYDRKIEVIINTHPQEDHYLGLIEVIRRYKVDKFVTNSLDSGNQSYQALKKEVGSHGITVINSTAGMSIRYNLLQLDILNPFVDVLGEKRGLGIYTSTLDPNKFSVVDIVSLGSFKALFTGDIDPEGISAILSRSKIPHVQYIKIPHHGSRNGLSEELLQAIKPKVAVISVGKNNMFGHPHKEVLNMLEKHNVYVLRTDEIGDIEVVSDGKKFWIKK